MTEQSKPAGPSRVRTIPAAVAVLPLLAALTLSCVPAERQVSGGSGPRGLERSFTGISERTLPAVVSISCELQAPDAEQARRLMREWFEQHQYPMPKGLLDEQGGKSDGSTGKSGSDEPRPGSMGSGWIYDADGFIVTNAHVVRNAGRINVRLNDIPDDIKMYPAELWATDPKSELAVLKIQVDRKLPVLQLGNSEALKVGSWVMAFGSPFALQQTVTVGVVSAKGRVLPGQSKYITLGDIIQTDASINVGNSGGPLVNLNGEVVGINVAIATPQPGLLAGSVGIGFAIPADTAAYVIPRLIEKRDVHRGWLGVRIEDLTPNMRDLYAAPHGGALVTKSFTEAPGERAGLRSDDVIVAVGERNVTSTWDLQKAISRSAPGAQVTLTIIRDGKEMALTATLGEMPAKYAGAPPQRPEPPKHEKRQLGLQVKAIDPKLKKQFDLHYEQGAVVVGVRSGSAAAGKIKPGDVILKVNRDEVGSMAEYEKAIKAAQSAGRDYILLRVERTLDDGEITLVTADIDLKP